MVAAVQRFVVRRLGVAGGQRNAAATPVSTTTLQKNPRAQLARAPLRGDADHRSPG